MDARVDKTLRITTPSDFEFAMTRQFDAPRRFVFDAMTKPEYLVRWRWTPNAISTANSLSNRARHCRRRSTVLSTHNACCAECLRI